MAWTISKAALDAIKRRKRKGTMKSKKWVKRKLEEWQMLT